MTPSDEPRPSAPVRWRPAVVILALAALGVTILWVRGGPTRQHLVLGTFYVLVLTFVLLLVWFFFASRLSRRARLVGAGALVLLGLGASQLLEVRGVSGDLLPVVTWRWKPGGDALAGGGLLAATVPEVLESPRDFHQFLGPGRDGRLPGVRLARDWQAHPPEKVWSRPVGEGWSGFAVAGEVAVTQEQRGDLEVVAAYHLHTGEPIWHQMNQARFDKTIAGVGPRATPAVAGGRVYTVGAQGLLSALDLATGERLWQHDLVREYDAVIPDWGKSGSPLVVPAAELSGTHTEALVVVSTGGDHALVAFDAVTGEEVWTGGEEMVSYSSPLLATLAGVRQIVLFNEGSITGHDPASGAVLWREPWPAQQPNVAQPVVLPGDRLLVSSGYGVGSKLFEFTAGAGGALQSTTVWESRGLKAKFSQVVEAEGFLYGLDDGILVCLDPATGERCWKRGRYGHGQILLVGDLLLVLGEGGELVLIDPSPDELHELATVPVLDGKTWNTMALVGDLLLVRNASEAACWRLPLREAGEEAPSPPPET